MIPPEENKLNKIRASSDDAKITDPENHLDSESDGIVLNDKNVHFTKPDEESDSLSHKLKNFNISMSSKEFLQTSNPFSSSSKNVIFSPFSKFYVLWIYLLWFFVAYDLVIVPFDICFSPSFSIEILIIDLIRMAIYFIDILVRFNCAFKHHK